MTAEVFSPAEAEALERSMLLGLSRNPLPEVKPPGFGSAPGALASLALLAQRARFRRPPAARGPLRRILLPEDERCILTGPLRDELVRLLTSRDREVGETMAQAVFRLLRFHRLRPHPFDLPKLAPVLASVRDELGPVESAFLSLWHEPSATGPAIAEGNWADFPKAERLQFIRRLRRENPDRARSLIEARLPHEPPAMRADLVEALRDRLGPADHDLLESLGRERAPSVRNAAQGLLRQIPGTPAYAERLKQLVERFELKRSGILRRQPVLRFTPPPLPSGSVRGVTHGELLSGIRLSDLAQALELDLRAFLDAIPGSDPELALALLSCAVAEGLFDLVPVLSPHAAGVGLYGIVIGIACDLDRHAPEARENVLRMLFETGEPGEFPGSMAWRTVGEDLPDGLPPDIAETVLGWTSWASLLQEFPTKRDPDMRRALLDFTVLVRHPQAAILARDLEKLPADAAEPALSYARFTSAVAAFAQTGPAETEETTP